MPGSNFSIIRGAEEQIKAITDQVRKMANAILHFASSKSYNFVPAGISVFFNIQESFALQIVLDLWSQLGPESQLFSTVVIKWDVPWWILSTTTIVARTVVKVTSHVVKQAEWKSCLLKDFSSAQNWNPLAGSPFSLKKRAKGLPAEGFQLRGVRGAMDFLLGLPERSEYSTGNPGGFESPRPQLTPPQHFHC